MSKKGPVPDTPFDFADARRARRGPDGKTYYDPPPGVAAKPPRKGKLHLLSPDASDDEIADLVRQVKGG